MSEEPAPRPRRYPSTVGGVCYLVMLLATMAGVALTGLVEWRLGVRVIAGSLLGLALLRLVMPEAQAGMLAVRRRWVDVALLVLVGLALLYLASDIPEQPTMPFAP